MISLQYTIRFSRLTVTVSRRVTLPNYAALSSVNTALGHGIRLQWSSNQSSTLLAQAWCREPDKHARPPRYLSSNPSHEICQNKI